MRKYLSLFLVFVMLTTLCACEKNNAKTSKPTETPVQMNTVPTVPTEEEHEKLTEEIYRSSSFSEGLAVVVAGGKNGRGCAINKKGEVVFDLPFAIENSYIVSNVQFINGFASINNGILDNKGNITYPEDVGASQFYPVALEAGYIVAEVIEADFASTTKKLGVLNTNFEWVVQPTEEFYTALEHKYGYIALESEDYYYYQGFLYVKCVEKFLNLKTGELVEYENVGFEHPSFSWEMYTDGTYRDFEGNVRLDFSTYENLDPYNLRQFDNGIALLVFKNQEAKTSYFTAVNEKGEFLFEPVDIKEMSVTSVQTDGNTILVTCSTSSTKLILKSYDMQGNLISEFDTDSIGVYCSYSATLSDGVIVIDGGYNFSDNYAWYYTTSFEPLF
ncbi:MAG: hypothetical protein IJE24_04580 [Oscillospiraceae bacterium]|nr:hypothetical protein [Oscillospiraceae bacterium]